MKFSKLLAIASLLGSAFIGTASATVVYGLTSTNTLVSFDSATPGIVTSNVSVSGLSTGEVFRGIDFRPADGEIGRASCRERVL